MSEEDVLAALKAVKDADASREAPRAVEDRLQFAFRRKRRAIRRWPWMLAVAAAVVVMISTIYFRPRRVEEPVRTVVVETPRVEQQAPVVAVTQAKRSARPARRMQPREVMTDFFPLVDVAPSVDRAELVRVSLPAAAMRTVGLPVREDRLSERVNADVLVSEEGVATAIRFVKFQ
jgi:hypothetical protein